MAEAANNHPEEKENDLRIDVLPLEKAALVLRAGDHPLRQRILQLLHRQGKATVTEIYGKLRLQQAVASQHLTVLRKAGLVSAEQDGKFSWYSVNYERLHQLQQLARELLN
jgi:DNA-binding transcriptional ArsR family regulator